MPKIMKSNTPSEKVNRRDFLKSGAGTVAAGAVGGLATQGVTQAQTETAKAATVSAFETETGGRIYNLPRDHAMHAGEWYKGAEYQETNYFTGFFKEKKTGKPYSVFFCWSVYGWDAKLQRPLWVALFSMCDIERKKFYQAVQPMSGPVTGVGSGPAVDPKDFFAEYTIGKGADGSEGLFSYHSAGEAWRWMANVPQPSKNIPNQTPFGEFFFQVRINEA